MPNATKVVLDEITLYVHVLRDAEHGHNLIDPCKWRWYVTTTPDLPRFPTGEVHTLHGAVLRSWFAGWRTTALSSARRWCRKNAPSLAGRTQASDYRRYTYTATRSVDDR